MESKPNTPPGANGNAATGARVDQASNTAHKAVDRTAEATRPLVDKAAESAHQVLDSVANGAASLQTSTTSMHNKINAAGDAARPAVDRILTGAHQAVDKLSGLAIVAADTVSEKRVQLKEASAKLMANGRVQVREKPAVAVGIAVVAGFILGRLLGSRRN